MSWGFAFSVNFWTNSSPDTHWHPQVAAHRHWSNCFAIFVGVWFRSRCCGAATATDEKDLPVPPQRLTKKNCQSRHGATTWGLSSPFLPLPPVSSSTPYPLLYSSSSLSPPPSSQPPHLTYSTNPSTNSPSHRSVEPGTTRTQPTIQTAHTEQGGE